MKVSKYIIIITSLLIIAAALAISLPGVFSSSPSYPDGQRYAFNGILLHDMIRDGAIFHPYEYNIKFYAQYPATNLPYGPPFFALVFAAAFSIFGISFSVARCVVALYTVGAALMCWYLVYKTERHYWISVLAVAAFLFNPVIGTCARDPGPELAVAFHAFLTIYFFYNYVEFERKYFAIYAALALGLGYLTKQYMIPLGIALALYVFIRRRWNILYKGETWLAVGILGLLTIPYTLLTFSYSIEGVGFKSFPPLSVDLMLGYPRLLIKTIPVLFFGSIFGFVLGSYQKNRLILLCLAWTVCWYIYHTFYFGYYIGFRYISILIPALVLPFALAFYEATLFLKRLRLDKLLIGLLIVWFAYSAISTPVSYVQGYEEAGEFVAENPRGKSVLFYGGYDGAFMMGVRRHISQGGPYVLRGERQLAVRLWYDDKALSVSSRSPDDIIDLLNKYQTGYVVVEKEMPEAKDFPEYKLLIQTLGDTDLFEEVRRFPIRTNHKTLGPELIVYKFHFSEGMGKAKTLKIPVPTLDRNLDVAF